MSLRWKDRVFSRCQQVDQQQYALILVVGEEDCLDFGEAAVV